MDSRDNNVDELLGLCSGTFSSVSTGKFSCTWLEADVLVWAVEAVIILVVYVTVAVRNNWQLVRIKWKKLLLEGPYFACIALSTCIW